MTEDKAQLRIPCGDRQVPSSKIRRIGRRQVDPMTQGDLLKPDKIRLGNMPQDQLNSLADNKVKGIEP